MRGLLGGAASKGSDKGAAPEGAAAVGKGQLGTLSAVEWKADSV